MILEVTFEQKKTQFFRRCQNHSCEVLQFYYSVSKQPPTFLYEIINSKCKNKQREFLKIIKLVKFPSMLSRGYGQHFMSRS